ncbi:MAG: hypothetical protein HY695_27765 [Deltaproteobacteria bacterium]|nr:hypothetical protein [Deltaproteobacteria bacterium]
MIAKLSALSFLGFFFLTANAPQSDAQQPPAPPVKINAKFRYSVKFVCGHAQEPKPCEQFRQGGDSSGEVIWICPGSTVPAGANGAQVVSGLYATAINVSNPGGPRRGETGTAVFAKKFAIALPWQNSGPVSRFERAILEADHAFEIDCEEIAAKFSRPSSDSSTPTPFPVFLKGFLLIVSPVELDITAVYTARGSGGVSTMDVEIIQPRKQEQVVIAEIPAEIPTD